MKKFNKRGQAGMIFAIILLFVLVTIAGIGVTFMVRGGGVSETAIGSQVQQIAQQTKEGNVAQIKVDVRDLANDDVNTKLAVAVYCMDSKGAFIIDGTTSSTTTKISGSTTRGETVTCYAFSSTIQTLKPSIVTIDGEIAHVTIDAYTLSTAGKIDFFDDSFVVSDNGTAGTNITLSSEGSDTYQKLKFTNTATDQFLPLGGFYVDVIEATNMSNIDISGGAVVSGRAVSDDNRASRFVVSSLTTRVTARKSLFDFVFEVDDGNAVPGNDGLQPILLDQNDFIESGIVTVESENSLGCDSSGEISVDIARWFAFSKGYYREQQGTGVGYGHETDATSSSVISADIALDHFICGDI